MTATSTPQTKQPNPTAANDYYGNSNPDLLAAVAPDAQRICEFGCGAGALARAIRQKLPKVHYTGLEFMEEPLDRARPVLHAALQCDLNNLASWSIGSNSILQRNSYDHLIFGDVLEHLLEPEKVLMQAVELLEPSGRVLVCIPNVQHWSTFWYLLNGRWPKTDSGLFDRTHLRWFTLTTMQELLKQAGLAVETIKGRVPHMNDSGIAVRNKVLRGLDLAAKEMGIPSKALIQNAQPLQFVLVGRKFSG